jgi:hypothetical protein
MMVEDHLRDELIWGPSDRLWNPGKGSLTSLSAIHGIPSRGSMKKKACVQRDGELLLSPVNQLGWGKIEMHKRDPSGFAVFDIEVL